MTFLTLIISCKSQPKDDNVITDTVFCTHKVVLDEQNKIVPWYSPAENAYDHFLHLRWDFIKNKSSQFTGTRSQVKISAVLFLLCIQCTQRLYPT